MHSRPHAPQHNAEETQHRSDRSAHAPVGPHLSDSAQELHAIGKRSFYSPTCSSFVDSRYVLGAGALIGGRFRLIKYIQSGTFKHGWKALDIQRRVGGEFPVVFLATLKTKEDTVGGKTISNLAVQVSPNARTFARCGTLRPTEWLRLCWGRPLAAAVAQ